MTEQVPPWLATMRAITGLTEYSSGSNPKIEFMAKYVGHRWPEQEEYASYYTGDEIAWCGLAVAFCVSMADIEPVFGATDTERWMWALAWSNWEGSEVLHEPQLGCIVVTEREGGGHVTLFEEMGSPGYYRCRGGNQSDQVKVSDIAISSVVQLVWPKYRAKPDLFSPEMTPQEISWTQSTLNLLDDANLEIDGETGPLTRDAITTYQHHQVIPVTGVADRRTVDAMLIGLEQWNDERYRNTK
jgi:uncharacterized protein (TIGR02594 family)